MQDKINVQELQKKAVARFCENPHWKKIYENAPEGAKRYYQASFGFSVTALLGRENGVGRDMIKELHEIYRGMDDESWDYVLDVAHTGSLTTSCGLATARLEYQKDSEWCARQRLAR